MTEFLLYFILPILVAVVGVSAYYAIKDGNETRRAEEAPLPQQPKPIHDAQFYMKNGHWIFGVRSQDAMLDDAEFAAIAGLGPIGEWDGHAQRGICLGECDRHGV